ncbi:hypothetical protein H8A97_12955 [Bradyrhizobium sp. Arg62]|uniref:hypothetical protein n=1 Tax=Bradyrhizobium brasilense TaxID=1419277 RepID=UPI001E2997D7|nr:hypothetical protein [Bradyrhizobium brasilense]MCC8945982.1 hypothetical protein [Bradyrhizobium brasilense]
MSWSVSGIGKTPAVKERVISQLNGIKCAEPEETIKGKVGEIIATALDAFPSDCAVQITASGSQYSPSGVGVVNSLNVEIKPIYGFVE